jgi:hypothetical protein
LPAEAHLDLLPIYEANCKQHLNALDESMAEDGRTSFLAQQKGRVASLDSKERLAFPALGERAVNPPEIADQDAAFS